MKFVRKINNILSIGFNHTKTVASTEAIDIIIPVIKKDLTVLPLCLQGVKNCVQHPVKDIYIVSPPEDEIRLFCRNNGLHFIEESEALGFSPKELALKITDDNGSVSDRSGWLFQQFIKLSGAIGTCENYLCIDADHVLLQPHAFLNPAGEPIFYMSYESHPPYYKMITALTGITAFSTRSYVAHKMIINKPQLSALQNHISEYCRKPWIEAILLNYDRRQISGFSEYETYGNFVKNKTMLPWKQHSLPYKNLANYQTLQKRYGKIFRSVTFPEYYNEIKTS